MSTSPIFKGNTPLMHFSFVNDQREVVPLPNDLTKFTVYVHDTVSVRTGVGTLSNLNTNAGTVDYLVAAADTANAGVATWWVNVLLPGETQPRTFDPQKILVEDPAIV